jgi:hypothetical protein
MSIYSTIIFNVPITTTRDISFFMDCHLVNTSSLLVHKVINPSQKGVFVKTGKQAGHMFVQLTPE